LFFLRSFHRICCFFAFDTFTGATILEQFPDARLTGLFVLLLDGLIYLLIATLGLIGIAYSLNTGQPGRMVCMLIVTYAFPYFIAFSHPTYHLPIVPLFALMASKGVSEHVWISSRLHTRKLTLAALLIFWALQGEWIWRMLSATGV
jgi:hypothetical protein